MIPIVDSSSIDLVGLKILGLFFLSLTPIIVISYLTRNKEIQNIDKVKEHT